MSLPKSREEAKGTHFEGLWQTPPHWPNDVHKIPLDAMDSLGLDTKNNLYWDGVPIVTKRTVQLEGWSLLLAAVATLATVVAAIWPIGLHFKLW